MSSLRTSKEIRLVELFSGIGGFRIALENAIKLFKVFGDEEPYFKLKSVLSIDTSRVVNQCYELNFKKTNRKRKRPVEEPEEGICDTMLQANIESLKLSDLDGAGNVWTMSPPCQPFTTTDQSKQLGAKDKRNKAFAYIMEILPKLQNPPELIFFENVKGFNGTDVHKSWINCLLGCGYAVEQFELSPLDFGIPMNRTRFYVTATLQEKSQLASSSTDDVPTEIAKCKCPYPLRFIVPDFKGPREHVAQDIIDLEITNVELGSNVSGPKTALPLKYFTLNEKQLEENDSLQKYIISDEALKKKYAPGFSIVGTEDRVTFCFTSSYGQRLHKSSGSLFHMNITKGKEVDKSPETMAIANTGQVRLFSPIELLHLFGFPKWYKMPPIDATTEKGSHDAFTLRHQWRAIGQGISITVVEKIIHKAFCDLKHRP